MAEVSNAISEEELKILANEVLKNKDARGIGNKLIKSTCFAKIKEIVESSVELK